MSKRNLTIGVTVNLKNYESFRLEISDEVESEEDVLALTQFLDQTLALFGRGNAETEELIAHYRRRVLESALSPASAPTAPAPTLKPAAPKAAPPKPAAPTPPPAAPEPVAAPLEPAAPPEEPAPVPEPAAPRAPAEPAPAPPAPAPAVPTPKPAAKPAAKAPAPSPTGAVCEECGAPVTAAEEKTSRLFVSKTLCKRCIQNL